MGVLSRRFIDLQIDTVHITGVRFPGLRVVAKAVKTLAQKPNTCDVSVYNLAPNLRAALTATQHPTVALTAGYEDDRTQIFLGQAVHVSHTRQGPDIITTVTTSDGGDKLQKGRIHQSFGPRAKPGDVLLALVKALGLSPGNAVQVAARLDGGQAATLYAGGVTLDGHCAPALTALCRSAGLEWSVQDGALQIVDVGAALNKFAIVLNESLLVGSPSVSNKNVVEGATLIQNDFTPGRQIRIEHPDVSGAFRLEKCGYSLDTHADDWYVDFEAKGPAPS